MSNTCPFSWKGFPRHFKNAYFASALGGAFAMGTNTMALMQAPNMTVPQRTSVSAQLTNCNVGPRHAHIGACWDNR